MMQFIYRGEPERDFYLLFTKAVGLDRIDFPSEEAAAAEPLHPLGEILVAADFADSWIMECRNYLGWKVSARAETSDRMPGFSDPHWELLQQQVGANSRVKFIIYLRPDGKVEGDTISASFPIADSQEAFRAIPQEQLEQLCYRREMSAAR